MIIQAYNDGENAIFKNDKLLCKFWVKPALKKLVDNHLHILHLYRNSTWTDLGWGSEAKVRFRTFK